MKPLIIAGAPCLPLALGACNPEQVNTFCRSTSLDQVRFSRTSVDGLTAPDRRKYLAILENGAAMSGWRSGR